MQEDLRSLLELQSKDQGVMSVEAELAALEPQRAELDSAMARLESELEAAQNRLAQSTERREALEGKIESYRVMQERRRQRLEWVRGAKEASTLMAEIDLARGVLAKEEAEWIRSADEVQHAEQAAAEAQQRLDELREGQREQREEIASREQNCRERLEAARQEREKVATQVAQRALTSYERVRRGRAPLALYPLRSGACGHCFTSVPLHLRQQLQQHEGVATCEACGVMMYLDSA